VADLLVAASSVPAVARGTGHARRRSLKHEGAVTRLSDDATPAVRDIVSDTGAE
jgi:hypothetical protein